MFTYLLWVFFIFTAISFFDLINLQIEARKILYGFMFIILVFTAGSRYGDRDFFNYQYVYLKSPDWFENSGWLLQYSQMEPGYLFFNSLLKTIGLSFPWFLTTFAFCSVGMCFIFFKRYTHFFLLAAVLYFTHVFLNREMVQIRAGFSVAVSMFSIPYIADRKLFRVSLILIFASLFHFVALFFFLIYFSFPFLTKSKYQISLILFGMLFGSTLTLSNFRALQTVLNNPLLYTYLVDKTYNYSLSLLNPILIKHLIVIPILIYNKNFFQEKIPYFNVLLVSYVIAAFWLSTFNNFAILAGRIATLFSNVEHVLIPSLLLLQRYKLIIYIGIVGYSFVAFFTKLEDLKLIYFFFQK